MNIDLLIGGLGIFFRGFLDSPFFLVLKLLLAIYVTVLFADIIMLMILRPISDVRSTFRGANIPLVSPKKNRKKWKKIQSYLDSDDQSQLKLAVLEADLVVEKIICSIITKGQDMVEKLETLKPNQLEDIEELKNAHKIRNQIVHDGSFQLDKSEAQRIIGVYEKFLVENEFMED